MLSRCRQTLLASFLICVGSVGVLGGASSDVNGMPPGRRGGDRTAEEELLAALGLNKDVTDAEIISLLDKPGRSIYAAGLIDYRRISVAIPDLLRIVQDEKRLVPERFACARTLCDLGNKDWIQPIKKLSADPNGELSRAYGVDVAGLLARAGDYSRFDVVVNHLKDKEGRTQVIAVSALANFADEKDPTAIAAADLLHSIATSDSNPWLRGHAIRCLDKIAEKRPEAKAKLIDAAEVNARASDIGLRAQSQTTLKKYGRKLPAGMGTSDPSTQKQGDSK